MMNWKSIGSGLGLAVACIACSTHDLNLSGNSLIIDLASPIVIEESETIVFLDDYLATGVTLDSAILEGKNIEIVDDKLIVKSQLTSPLTNLRVWSKGNYADIPAKKGFTKSVTLRFNGEAEVIQSKGEFNAWNPASTVFSKKVEGYEATLQLPPGRYQYLFVIDGVEQLDPANPDSVANGIGGWNSLLDIPRPDPYTLPKIEGQSIDGQKISMNSTTNTDELIVFLENIRLPNELIKRTETGFSFTIPKVASGRSFLRIWGVNKMGASNELLVPLQDGKVIENTNELTRGDKHSDIMYFLMVDRFNDAEKSNNHPLSDPTVNPKVNYYGGDLAGVTEKVNSGYFDSIGVNTIWLSPITQNPEGAYGNYPNPKTTFSGYHGYWPISSSKVDYRYGTSEELHALVDAAHDDDKNVILDYVANHVHEEHPLYKQHPDWVTNLYLPDGTLNTQLWDEQRLTTWFDTFMPTLDLEREEVVETMTDSALFWLKEYNLDGFRHDATKHIPLAFWRTLTRKTKEQIIEPQGKSVLQIGETYGSRALINSYIGSGLLDAQFDFNLYDDAISTFALSDVPFSRLITSLNESLSYYGDHHLMGNITGNQDRARFISYADGSVRFDEDAKLAGWTRSIEIQDTLAYRKLSLLTAFMVSIPGIPTIYYGDEIGSPGGNDPDNRRMMIFDGLDEHQKQTWETAAKLIHLRKNNMALLYGDFETVEVQEDFLVLKRSYFDQVVYVIFNKSQSNKSFEITEDKTFHSHFNSILTKNNSGLKVTLEPLSVEFLTTNP